MKSKNEDLGGKVSGAVIGAALAVHREFGPGMDEPDYERALSLELAALGIEHQCQVPLPIVYKGMHLDCGYRMDLVLPGLLLAELKAAENLHPVHEAQLLTYLRLSGLPLGLLINFCVLLLRDGILRRACTTPRTFKPNEPVGVSRQGGVFDDFSREVIEAAIEVHRHLGPGLLRSAYETCLCHELHLRGLRFVKHQTAMLRYREQLIPSAKELPLVVEERLMIASHCVREVTSLHLARSRSLLRAGNATTGLVINFHATALSGQIRRIQRSTAEDGKTQRK